MNLTYQEPEIIDNVSRYLPNISIILPFEQDKSTLESKLESAIQHAETELGRQFSAGSIASVVNKLKVLARHLNFYTAKRSIAIFVSPVTEKVLYFDTRVEEKISINDHFRVRDILYYKKHTLLHAEDSFTHAHYLRRGHKFSFGIREAWTYAQQNNIRLLVVERDLKGFPCYATECRSYCNDIVDAVIEKVLENGGEAELVGNGALREYDGLAFIKLY